MFKQLFLVITLCVMSSARASCYSAPCMDLISKGAENCPGNCAKGCASLYRYPADKHGQWQQHRVALCANCVAMTGATAAGLVVLLGMKPAVGCAAVIKALMACNGGCCIGCSGHACMQMRQLNREMEAETRPVQAPIPTELVSTSLYQALKTKK